MANNTAQAHAMGGGQDGGQGAGPRFRQPAGTIAYDRIGLGEETNRRVVELLNRHLGTYYTLFHMYRKHHWCVQGPQFYELHLLLEKNYTEVDLHGDLIAERIRVLGGVPVSGPAAQQEAAYIPVEPEGILPLRESLEGDLRAEGEIARRLREDIRAAIELEDYGTEDTLGGGDALLRHDFYGAKPTRRSKSVKRGSGRRLSRRGSTLSNTK